MASTYSTNLKIELQATGENSGTWGTITNTNLGTALEQAIVGYGNPSYASDANLTLTYTDTNAAQAARALVLNVTSAVSLTATRELVVPTIQKQYIVQNNTTGSQSITVKTSAGTGITVPNGRKAHLYVDGTNVIYMDDYVDINGGAIDGTPIGASSASTGSFTTLTTSSTVTLNGGTANGVLYLNGSKVATSGSALTFDGTNLTATRGLKAASGGIVVSSFVDGLSVGGYDSIGFLASPGNALAVGGYRAAQWSAVEFYASGSLQATLTSTGLGIGTTPSGYLANKVVISTGTDSNNGITIASATNRNGSIWFADGTTGDQAYRGGVDYQHTTDTLYLYSGGQGNFQLTSSGNLGLGVTPSAWSSLRRAIALGAAGNAIAGGTTNGALELYSNATINASGNYIYSSTGTASLYSMSGNTYSWSIAASGTAGNTITFTQAMTLDASGNLALGTTSAVGRFTLSDTGTTTEITLRSSGGVGNNNRARIIGGYESGGSDYGGYLAFNTTSSSNVNGERARITAAGNVGIGTSSPQELLSLYKNGNSLMVDIGTNTNSNEVLGGFDWINSYNTNNYNTARIDAYADGATNSAALRFWTASASSTPTERARITAGGSLGVGTTSPTSLIHGKGISNADVTYRFEPITNSYKSTLYVSSISSGDGAIRYDSNANQLGLISYSDLLFYVGTANISGNVGNERARITAGGYFKASNAGTYVSSTSTYHELYSNAGSDWIGYFTQATATSPNGVVIQYTAAAPNGTANTFIYCQDNAAVRATIRSNGGLANYQANDVNLSDQRVKKDVKPLGSMWDKFKAIEIVTFKYKDQTHDDDNIGVIAQQVESVAPEFIDTDGFGETPEGEEPLKTVYTTDMYHAAIKALQEAMARIEQLEAKVAVLESK